MEIFLKLYSSLLPYLLCIPIGYWLEKKSLVQKSWLTVPLIYVLMPVLVIDHLLEADPVKLTVLPVLAFLLAMGMVLPAKYAYRTFASDFDPNLLKSSFSFFNIAFFGIPIVTALFGEEGVTVLICIYIGSALYGDIIGYFQIARSRFSFWESIKKVFKIPFIYAFSAGIVLKSVGADLPEEIEPVTDTFGTLVSVLGMMVIGTNLTKLNFKSINWEFIRKTLLLRTFAAILLMGLLIGGEFLLVDKLEEMDRQMLAMIALFPVAANITVFAAFFESEEENSALLVLITMLLSLILVPLLALTF